MPIAFRRLVGAAADVKELEYVSALMQTDLTEVRKDASISANDIVLFLRSRYGIDVTVEHVREKIIHGFGTGLDEVDYLDLMNVATMLLIPTCCKAAAAVTEGLPSNLIKPRDGLLQFVLDMILHDTTGDHTPKPLTKTLIQKVLISYGEHDLACNDELIEEMLYAATMKREDSSDKESPLLSLESFSRALTADTKLYDIRNEARLTTNFDDVFLNRNERERWHVDEVDEETAVMAARKSISTSVPRRWTAAQFDMVAETYRSKTLLVCLWTSMIVTYLAFYNSVDVRNRGDICEDKHFKYAGSWSENADPMGCYSSRSVVDWLLLFLWASMWGLVLIGAGSIGNYNECRRFFVPLIGWSVIFAMIWVPYFDFGVSRDYYLSTVGIALAGVAMLLHFCHAIILLIPRKWIHKTPRIERLLSSQSVVAEVRTKKAAAYKMHSLTKNALRIASIKDKDSVIETHFGQALQSYSKHGEKYEVSGGFLWTWKRVWSGQAFSEDGIWISARFLASNVAQFLVVVFVLIVGIRLTKTATQEYSAEAVKAGAGLYVNSLFNRTVSSRLVQDTVGRVTNVFGDFIVQNPDVKEICLSQNITNISASGCELIGDVFVCDGDENSDYLCTLVDYAASNPPNVSNAFNSSNFTQMDPRVTLGLLNASGMKVNALVNVTRRGLEKAAQSTIDSLYPTEVYMITVPLAVGSACAFLAAFALATTYLPSVTATTLKLRCGIIPTLRDENFHVYRIAADQVTLLTGSLFWGSLIAAALVGGVIGLIFFFFLWQATAALAQQLVGVIVGILVVILIKMVLVGCCRIKFYVAFYRKKPASANIASLALEAAHLALSIGFVALRTVKLLLAALFYVGRIDVPFLAPGVGKIGGVELDNYPQIFLKDVLAHEAHRHPYIELLGVNFMMKLRYETNFANRAGSTWRLIFVYALCPWLSKYRILPQEPLTEEEDEEEVRSRELSFVPLHKSYGAEGGEKRDRRVSQRPSMMRRRSSATSRTLRHSLLVQELGDARLVELESEKISLQEQVEAMQSEIESLKAQIPVVSEGLSVVSEEPSEKSNPDETDEAVQSSGDFEK